MITLCPYCQAYLAAIQCTDCDIVFCKDCFNSIHTLSNMTEHHIMDISSGMELSPEELKRQMKGISKKNRRESELSKSSSGLTSDQQMHLSSEDTGSNHIKRPAGIWSSNPQSKCDAADAHLLQFLRGQPGDTSKQQKSQNPSSSGRPLRLPPVTKDTLFPSSLPSPHVNGNFPSLIGTRFPSKRTNIPSTTSPTTSSSSSGSSISAKASVSSSPNRGTAMNASPRNDTFIRSLYERYDELNTTVLTLEEDMAKWANIVRQNSQPDVLANANTQLQETAGRLKNAQQSRDTAVVAIILNSPTALAMVQKLTLHMDQLTDIEIVQTGIHQNLARLREKIQAVNSYFAGMQRMEDVVKSMDSIDPNLFHKDVSRLNDRIQAKDRTLEMFQTERELDLIKLVQYSKHVRQLLTKGFANLKRQMQAQAVSEIEQRLRKRQKHLEAMEKQQNFSSKSDGYPVKVHDLTS